MTVTKEITTQQTVIRVQLSEHLEAPMYQGICGADFLFYPDARHGLLMPVKDLAAFFNSKSVFILTHFEVFGMELGIDWFFCTLPHTPPNTKPVACLTRKGLQRYLALMPQSRIVTEFRFIVVTKTKGGEYGN